jgi:hypothetical protein
VKIATRSRNWTARLSHGSAQVHQTASGQTTFQLTGTLNCGNRSGGRRAGLKDALVLQGMLHPWRATSWIRRSTRDAMR